MNLLGTRLGLHCTSVKIFPVEHLNVLGPTINEGIQLFVSLRYYKVYRYYCYITVPFLHIHVEVIVQYYFVLSTCLGHC